MSTPDITPAQVIAALTALAGALVVLFKLPLTAEQQGALTAAIATIVPIAWLFADAIIRHGRANVQAAVQNLAAAQIASTPADQGDKAP